MTEATTIFNELISICEEARAFYSDAAHHHTGDIALLSHLALVRHTVIGHLSHYLKATGRKQDRPPQDENEPRFTFNTNYNSQFNAAPALTLPLIAAIESMENTTIDKFYDAMGSNIPASAKAILSQQIETLSEARRLVRVAKEHMVVRERDHHTT